MDLLSGRPGRSEIEGVDVVLLGGSGKLVETATDIFEEFGVAVLRSGGKVISLATSAQREPG